MPEPTGTRRFLELLRGRHGRRVLVLLLFAGIGAVLWWYVGRMPGDGSVEVRWTGSPPLWLSISYTDESGARVRWRREDVLPGAGRFRDDYRLPRGPTVRFEYSRADRIRTIRKRVELPSSQPYVLMRADEPEAP